MIKIYNSILEIKNGYSKISAKYEIDGEINYLWYTVLEKYKNFLVTENVDSFFMGLLLYGMKNGHDIEIFAPISEKLYYNVKYYILKALNLSYPELKIINIYPKYLSSKNLNVEKAACTGFSAGVDSFSTIYEHLNELEPYKIKYFTFFNAGSHGDYGGEKSREVFYKRLKLIKPYADEMNIEIVTIDTNLNEILKMTHLYTHFIRSISCVLNIQKLAKFYYYSSAFRLDCFISPSNYDILMTNIFSTESTNILSSSSRYTRIERTDMITNYKPTYKYLNVCIASSTSFEVENCSVCLKCLRTELTLEVLGKLYLYKDVFDIDKYNSVKDKFIGSIMADKKSIASVYYKEIFYLMKKNKYKISLNAYFYFIVIKLKTIIKSILIKVFGKKLCKKIKIFYKNHSEQTC